MPSSFRMARRVPVGMSPAWLGITAERLTGYLVGGISPFGIKRALPVVMDAAIAVYDKVMINAGSRGIMVKMAPADIVRTLGALVSDVAV